MKKSALPKPNVTYRSHGSDFLDEKSLKGMICNPAYAGLPPFPQIISDEAWIKAATQLINEEGPEQFLVNMLYMLRQNMAEYINGQLELNGSNDEETTENESAELIYCYHDDFPLVKVNGSHVCVAEFLFDHLDNSPVTDLISEPVLTLIFQNGHTMPLFCPDCGESLHVDNEDELLNSLNGLSIIDLGWDDDTEALILEFGYPYNDDEEDIIPVETLEVHLDSVRELTCPNLSGFESREETE
jgi:hypothetical protein